MKTLGAIAGVIILLIVVSFQVDLLNSQPAANTKNELLGHKVPITDIRPLQQSDNINDVPSKKILLIVSPTCPHCITTLKTLNRIGKEKRDSLHIYAIFKKAVHNEDIKKLLNSENLEVPVYKLNNSFLIKKIKFVPTFIYVNSNGTIENSRTGSIETEKDLIQVISSLQSYKSWYLKKYSSVPPACSL